MPCYNERSGFTGGARRTTAPSRVPRPASSSDESVARKVIAASRLNSTLFTPPADLTRSNASGAVRSLAAGWARVAARPRNSRYAGQRFPLERLSPELARKYPESIQIDAEGFPDFSPWARATVRVPGFNSSRGSDFADADRRSGWSEDLRRQQGLTWHHVQDGETLMLVPTDLHQAIGHHGGVAHGERVAGPQALITNYVLDALKDL